MILSVTNANYFTGIIESRSNNDACDITKWTTCIGLTDCFDLAIEYANISIAGVILWPKSCDTYIIDMATDNTNTSDMTALVIPRNVTNCQITHMGTVCYSFEECTRVICEQQLEWPRDIITIMFA